MKLREYFEMEGLEEIYLEDSYVLGIEQTKDLIAFQMETVLTERHPLYTPPLPNEQYCYRKGEISFRGLKYVTWHEHDMIKARSIDADGEVDYGNIDYFYEENAIYHLGGSWGEVCIESDKPEYRIAKNNL